MADRPQLRILCFGDSLTAGYSCFGAIHHPYNTKLEEMVAMAFPHLSISTDEDGMDGDTVKHGFVKRIEEHFPPTRSKRKADQESKCDWVIVLGGTNDIALGVPPEEIFAKLQEVWDMPLQRKCKVLALTVPEAGIKAPKIRERIDERRNKLNDLIRGYKRENFHVFDLNAAVTYFSMSPADRERYWDDHIHFTPDGYDLIGNKVGMALVSILAADPALNPPPPPRAAKRRRVFRDDEKKFEEETGDPKAIDQGYVVVRRVDLE